MFKLIDLPYAAEALEPVISARTLSFHRGKHLQTYVDNLNKLLPGSPFEGMTLEEIVVASSRVTLSGSEGSAQAVAVFNNAGQILNHNLYFTQFRSFGKPQDDNNVIQNDSVIQSDSVILSEAKNLTTQIKTQWGSLAAFKADFEAKGAGLFGSGWVWLAGTPDGTLTITQELGAGNPLTRGLTPILTFDVWEHAYYLDYQNRRAAHLAALWQIVDWEELQRRFGV